jgi:hypothetical protein
MADRLTRLSEHLFRFDDTCNVYLLVDGDAGLLHLEASGRGDIALTARAPLAADRVRRLMTAEIAIDGRTQGPISEALVTVAP